MKELSPENVKHVAHLARLEIKPEEELSFVQHMNKILSYVESLKEVNTEGVDPFFSPAKEHLEMYLEEEITHPDIIRESLGAEAILRNAPSKHQNQFSVEAVIEEN
jgi:aspartyl-tRNA(Asn)/glutamyl-tRNA(Gln) amidotransferase subunit C